jgi:hypothetical protein
MVLTFKSGEDADASGFPRYDDKNAGLITASPDDPLLLAFVSGSISNHSQYIMMV